MIQVPVGLSNMLGDGTAGPGFSDLSMFSNITFSKDHADGGHFAPSEIPESIVTDIRDTFRPLREA